eukprot:9282546-Pyramimonas_sp.AAC.1
MVPSLSQLRDHVSERVQIGLPRYAVKIAHPLEARLLRSVIYEGLDRTRTQLTQVQSDPRRRNPTAPGGTRPTQPSESLHHGPSGAKNSAPFPGC